MKINPIKLTEAREIIRQLNRLNLDTADYRHTQFLIKRLIHGLAFRAITPGLQIHLYRGVIYQSKPLETKYLRYPPNNLALNFQRCNPPGKSMFYCSPDSAAVFYELNVKPGDLVYLSAWSVIREFLLNQISPQNDEGVSSSVKEVISTYFETKFSQPVHETYSSQYKITSAIAEKLCSGEMIDGTSMFLGGLTYPSVAHPARSENVAIQPHVVDLCLRLDYVEELLVTSVDGYKIGYERKDFSSRFEDNNINWAGIPLQYKLAPGAMVKMSVEGGQWVARDEHGDIVPPG